MKKVFLMMVVFFIAVYFLIISYSADVQVNKYDSLEAVQNNKAIQEGWIPKILPHSAYDIVETHDIDVNMIFGKFSYKEIDEENFLGELKESTESNETYVWENFLFKVNREKNLVNFRNTPL